jgi:hypothetical protein
MGRLYSSEIGREYPSRVYPAWAVQAVARTQRRRVEDGDDWEDDDDDDSAFDDHLISSDPKANARMLSRLGQQMAMSDTLGRPLYDFEMDDDYGD